MLERDRNQEVRREAEQRDRLGTILWARGLAGGNRPFARPVKRVLGNLFPDDPLDDLSQFDEFAVSGAPCVRHRDCRVERGPGPTVRYSGSLTRSRINRCERPDSAVLPGARSARSSRSPSLP